MISAAFAYGNVQIVAIAGAETRNPRKSIPAALRATFTRVVMFYVLSIFVISLLIPADDPRLALGNGSVTQSPFVIAFSRAGIKGIPSLFNAVVFVWLLSIVTTAGLVSWGIICIAYLRFFYALQRQGISRERLPYVSPFQPYLAYFALAINVLVVLTSGWTLFMRDSFSFSGFVYYYFNCIMVPVLYCVCKYLRGDSLVRLEDIDFRTELMLISQEHEAQTHGPRRTRRN
ncbi:hypothetical protein EST38_g2520 [Candolleomyces aberdarensis]|uniref:Amino acid permease/ SLC12A domain-containing protein n=1 Tax=Candolleomyces aberdarensis TaxID=2316362 RepID=A0A4Q2DUF3_9AGAR|nr:hypothetical protein EST38_g2520 [Candolleomyces aberdarensis]